MNDTAKLDRAIRINVIGGSLMVGSAALAAVLIASGLLSVGSLTVASVALTAVSGSLLLWTARTMRQDRDDPAGIERRYESDARILGSAVIAVGLAVVVGLIAWGIAR